MFLGRGREINRRMDKIIADAARARDDIRRTLTTKGNDMTIAPQATNLADQIKRMSEDSKTRLQSAQAKLSSSFDKINQAASHVENVAATVEKSADDILASVGQLTNMGPAE